ncbi:MAG: SDR family NAD(P)-dependent oxidoreductase [Bryobacteraceae bacterium]|nr:SDR family NAD(P)-dependent oxidoreductase [Bryobacteraceae bacterium]MDW8378531.1 SDR family NAD(P)-dependent oxidoreductase [Bryobacterales bacterium]
MASYRLPGNFVRGLCMEIQGKVVLITGASEGIGAACAAEFSRQGAQLSLLARREDLLRRVGGDKAVITPGDVTQEADRRRAVEATLHRYGRIDILINNAGVGLYAPSWKAPFDSVRRMYEVNFFAALGMIQLVVPHMRQQRTGMIVNVSSIAGKVTLPWLTLYSASKHALSSLTQGLRMELKRDGIHVMLVCPGYVSTRFQQNILVGQVPGSVQSSKRFRITPEECAAAIADGVERQKRTVLTPRTGWLFVLLARLFPKWVDSTLEQMYWRGEQA